MGDQKSTVKTRIHIAVQFKIDGLTNRRIISQLNTRKEAKSTAMSKQMDKSQDSKLLE